MGTWRSYKTFYFRGEVKHHDVTCYREVVITAEGDLILRSFSAFTQKQVIKKGAWQVHADEERRFLYLQGKKAFEIITLEKTDLVLQDLVTGEKTFFAAIPLWQERIQPQKEINKNMYITLWSKSLIKLITLEK